MESYGSKPSKPHPHQKSNAELFSSAKLVADAAKSTLAHKSDEVDKGRVAGAAADLLGAASHYGKLEEKSFGKYVDKAEDYLHKYHSSHSSSPAAAGGGHDNNHSAPPTSHKPSESSSAGYGDYLKLAQGLLKKH